MYGADSAARGGRRLWSALTIGPRHTHPSPGDPERGSVAAGVSAVQAARSPTMDAGGEHWASESLSAARTPATPIPWSIRANEPVADSQTFTTRDAQPRRLDEHAFPQ